jgi:hypothetical protein
MRNNDYARKQFLRPPSLRNDVTNIPGLAPAQFDGAPRLPYSRPRMRRRVQQEQVEMLPAERPPPTVRKPGQLW